MAERKEGRVVFWQNLSSVLAIFRLTPAEGSRFPEYKAGQYIALRRDDCKLTKKVMVDGVSTIVPDIDENGNQKVGPVTHSYSISSAPFETVENVWLEFYVVLEKDNEGHPGRLTESFFHMNLLDDNKIMYVERIAGDFTLDKRAAGFKSVVFVGTGTGAAPFASMIKELNRAAEKGNNDGVQYTFLHANRTLEELAYHQVLLNIENSGKIDFVYVPSISRPTDRDQNDAAMGVGRANNILRLILDMPLKEEDDLTTAQIDGGDIEYAKTALERTIKPELPAQFTKEFVRSRFRPGETVVLSCGNPLSMADIQRSAETNRIRFEKEDW